MPRPSDTSNENRQRIERMGWPELSTLWEEIKKQDAVGWGEGKALEYLIIRGFALGGLEVEYPYEVPETGMTLEQIDGLVVKDGLIFLIECKDTAKVAIEPIAKLRNQLLRRPEITFGCVFVSGRFTASALMLADFSMPHRILLWTGLEVDECIRNRDFQTALRDKYRFLCKYGFTNHSTFYHELEIES